MSAERRSTKSKSLSPETQRRVARILEELIETQYRGKSERHIAERLGISQASLNAIRHLKGGIGAHVLIALRSATGRSIDDLLGLEPQDQRERAEQERVRRLVVQTLEQLRSAPVAEPPAPPPAPAPKGARPRR